MSQSRLLINNTLVTVVRMGLTFWFGLTTTRLIIGALGPTDYGIFTLIMGSVGFVALLQPAFINSAQRHMAHEIGRGDPDRLRVVFSSSVLAFLAVAAVLAVLALALLPVVLYVLQIPDERRGAAAIVYLMMTAQITLTAAGAPFGALAAAHQRLSRITLFQIMTSCGNLVSAIIVSRYAGDRLILYGALVTLVNVGYLGAMITYARWSFPHVRFSRRGVTWKEVRALGGFAGWILVDSMSVALRLQTAALLLGVFFMPAIVGGYGVAVNIAAYQAQWSGILWAAAMPAMASMHGAGRHDRLADLALKVSKMNGLLVQLLFVPMVLELPILLKLWLEEVPPYATIFGILVSASTILPPMAGGITMAMYAANRGRPVALISLITSFVPLAVAGVVFLVSAERPWLLSMLTLAATAMALPVTVLWLGPKLGAKPSRFLREVLVPYATVVAIEFAATMPIWLLMPDTPLRAALVIAVFIAVGSVAIWFFGLDDSDRLRFLGALPARLRRRIAVEGDG